MILDPNWVKSCSEYTERWNDILEAIAVAKNCAKCDNVAFYVLSRMLSNTYIEYRIGPYWLAKATNGSGTWDTTWRTCVVCLPESE